jgi:GNAT superfamily N-acetyltransferase
MNNESCLSETPWDKRAFSIETYELTAGTEEALRGATVTPGHFTVKVNPLDDTRLLNRFGFYYCDTLIEPFCDEAHFICHDDPKASVSRSVSREEILEICHGAYQHGRFHRDFNLPRELSDLRYDNWTRDLYDRGSCLALIYDTRLAGYFGYTGNRIVLHAVAHDFRGKGIAKYLWTVACRELFSSGLMELSSSISAANLSVMNLYASLGFRFRNVCDVYHRLNPG